MNSMNLKEPYEKQPMQGKGIKMPDFPAPPGFRLATTSFIYPDHIIPNVEKLGPFFDEIELLIFESSPAEVLPSKNDIRTLERYKTESRLTYNVHLPLDVSITDPSASRRKQALDRLIKVIDLFSPLTPSTFTLHLDFFGPGHEEKDIESFRQTASESLDRLTRSVEKPGLISVETLDYPFFYASPVVKAYELSVCADIGHLVKYGYSVSEFFQTWGPAISIVHLHGVDFSLHPPGDHTRLDRLPDKTFREIIDLLDCFTGVVSLEVFSKETLDSCLDSLKPCFSI
ncbi:MAG: cobamide remodeling phosphodiesterase CbiR [Desulfobacteraceae bacterium]